MTRDRDSFYDDVCDRSGLTRRQVLIWAGDRLADGAPVFVEAMRFHLHGSIDARRLARAFDDVLETADVFRTTLHEIDGWPLVRTGRSGAAPTEVVDLSHQAAPTGALDDLARDRIAACGLGRRLITGSVARLAPAHHVLLVVQHQLVSDAWSVRVMHERLVNSYRHGGSAPTIHRDSWPRFAEYVAYERCYRHSPRAAAARAWWNAVRAGCGRSESAGVGGKAGALGVQRLVVALGSARSAALRRAAAEAGPGDVGLFGCVAGVVAAHLHRMAGNDDVLLDVPFANRPSARFKDMLGSFMNVCPVRVGLTGSDRWCDLRSRLVAGAWEAARHQGFAGATGGVPQAYEVLVNVHRSVVASATFDACTMGVEWLPPTHRFGAVSVAVHDFGATGDIQIVLDLNAARFSDPERREFAASLLRLTDEQLADPERAIDNGAVRGASTSRLAPTVWSRFVAQAVATPMNVAVRTDAGEMTYAALAEEARGIAARLTAAGARRDTIVAVWGARGIGWVRWLLGVWGAGAVYLPIDPSWPPARIAGVLRRSGARLLAIDGTPPEVVWRLAAAEPEANWTLLSDEDRPDSAMTKPVPSDLGDVAYVLYTSGSTGEPKGALIEHAGLVNHLVAKVALLELGAGDRVAQNAPAGFDVSLWQCLAPLLVGGTVEIVSDAVARDPEALLDAAACRGITVLEVVPAMLRRILDLEDVVTTAATRLDGLRRLVSTGEALAPELCRRWFAHHPGVPLVNAYGPTECADDVTHHVLRAAPASDVARIPIGRPIGGMAVHVLDEDLRSVAVGTEGELCVSGVGVGRGYLHDEERTAAAFRTIALENGAMPVRVYRTGDRGRQRLDGEFEWLGRLDDQAKIRGVRVEPSEIEAVLVAHPDVADAAVVVQRDALETSRLVACVVPADRGGARADADADDAARVLEWARVWNDTYARESDAAVSADFNTAGWHSRYTREPIPAAELRVWLDATVTRVRALAPRRVLEIGCGSGMVLRQLAPACDRWVATDLSAAAVEYVRRHHLSAAGMDRVSVVQCAAHALDEVADLVPDVVLVNSVVQYFPSLGYLRRVLTAARALVAERASIFIGDVRSLPHARLLATAVELARAADGCTVADLRRRIDKSLARESELLIDPAFFRTLAGSRDHVVVQLKRGWAHNELTRFRYDVTWQLGHGAGAADDVVHDWTRDHLSLADVRALGRAHPRANVVVRGVPNARLQWERAAVELLATLDGSDTVARLRADLADRTDVAAVDPEEIWALAAAGVHEVEVTWSEAGLDRCDVRLRPHTAGPSRGKPRAASPRQMGEAVPHANDPHGAPASDALVARLRAWARSRLPEAMVPAAIVVMPALPRTTHGKVDRTALSAAAAVAQGERTAVRVSSSSQRAIAEIWSRLLGVGDFGAEEEFFALGGDSMLAYRVLREIRATLGVEVDVETFLARPTLAGIAAAVDAARAHGIAAHGIGAATAVGGVGLSGASASGAVIGEDADV